MASAIMPTLTIWRTASPGDPTAGCTARMAAPTGRLIGPTGHARGPAHPLRRRRVPVSSRTTRLGAGRRWHDESLGHRLERLRSGVRLQLRQSASVSCHPGAHYEPWRNRESSQYAYERIPTIADHLHFIGKGNIRDGHRLAGGRRSGGGHAHCGTMVYLGDNWPESVPQYECS